MMMTKSKGKTLSYIVAIITVALFFSHVFIPKTNPNTTKVKKEYSSLLKARDKEFKELELAFHSQDKNLTTEKLSLFIQTYNTSKLKYDEYGVAKNEDKVFGFKNLNVFSFQFSVFMICFLSATLFFLLTRKRIKEPSLKLAVKINSWIFMIISTYYIIYCFYPKSDLPYFAYISLMLLTSIFLSFGYFKALSWLSEKKFNSNLEIKKLVSFILRTRNKHYKTVATKALYSEIYDKAKKSDSTVEDDTNEFENDLFETLEKIKK